MNIVDLMLQFRETQDTNILIKSDFEIDRETLNSIVIEILAWLKLEYKRELWIQEGRKSCLKPLDLNFIFPWCSNLCILVDNEELFGNIFQVKDGKFDFCDSVDEKYKEIIRKSAYDNYNPQKNT